MKKQRRVLRLNLNFARAIWGQMPKTAQRELQELTAKYALSVPLGDVKYMENRWYVTHAGLLRLAQRRHCAGIKVQQVREFCDPTMGRWVFKATLYKNRGSQGFVGYGDADPSNTSPLVRGAEMRVAETRAVNRALRKAYGIGLCSVEELGWLTGFSKSSEEHPVQVKPPHETGSNNGQPKLRDRLCILIRRHNLDPTLVKAYAADYCGTSTLREANRELVESFIDYLAASALENKEALICRLNSYAQRMAAKS